MKRLLIRYLRIAGWLVFTVVVFMVLIEFTFYLTDVFAQRKAESLLQDVRNLRVGASTEDDVQMIVKRYGHETHQRFDFSGCEGTVELHDIRLANTPANWFGLRYPFVRLGGVRFWQVDAFLATARDRVCHVGFRFQPLPRHGNEWLDVSATWPSGSRPAQENYGMSFLRIHDGRQLRVYVWNGASEEERRRAFEFNLSCITTWSGCNAVCEVMPLAWHDYEKKARAENKPIPADETDNPQCNQSPRS